MPLVFTMHARTSPPPPAVRPGDRVRALGRDLKVTGAGLDIDSAGQYVEVEGAAALRQAVYHCLVTSPGDYRRRPRYGIGLLDFVGQETTPARIDEIRNRITTGLLQLRRVEAVREVAVDQPDAYTLRVHLQVAAVGRLVRFSPMVFRRDL